MLRASIDKKNPSYLETKIIIKNLEKSKKEKNL